MSLAQELGREICFRISNHIICDLSSLLGSLFQAKWIISLNLFDDSR